MKLIKHHLSVLIGLLLLLAGCASEQSVRQAESPALQTDTDALLTYQDEITIPFLRTHLSALAADSMEGREAGTRGQKMAARYLAEQYQKMGLEAIGDEGTYFQHFNLSAAKRDSTVFLTHKNTDGSPKRIDRSVESANQTGSYIRAFGGTDTLSGPIVFAGFGITDAARNIDHLRDMELEGKWVMVFQDIPHVVDGDTVVSMEIDNRHRFNEVLGRRGALGLLLIPPVDDKKFGELAKQVQHEYGKASRMTLAYRNGERNTGFSRGYNLIHPRLAARMLGVENTAGLRSSLIDRMEEFKPQPTGYSLTHLPYQGEVKVETENVVALFEGAHPRLKEEVIVITSHYDHVGIGQPDSTGDRIYNGADDDASGTAATLNIARALADAREDGYATKRSVLFLNVSAEEKGLLGSRYYSDHPIIPIDQTVANINTDMIGRIDRRHEEEGVENYAYIIGGKIISSELDSLLHVANRQSGKIELEDRYNDLSDPNQFYRRSDHWNFGRLGVPFVFFFTGIHEDYHQPSDEVHKIRFDKLARIVRTMYATTVLVANTDEAPKVDNQEFIEITRENER